MSVQATTQHVRALWIAPNLRRGAENLPSLLSNAGVSVLHLSTVQAAFDVLEDPDLVAPHCFFIDPSLPGIRTLLLAARAQPHLSHIPVVYVSDRIGQSVLDTAHALGADDVLWSSDTPLLRGLVEQLQAYDPSVRPAGNAGRVFILHPREERRRMLGRVYRNAGFHVVFGASTDDLMQAAAEPAPLRLVVASREALNGLSQIRTLRTYLGQPALPWVLLTTEKVTSPLGARVFPGVALLDEDGPTDNVLFVSNELLAGDAIGARRSRRYLLNGLCAFRGAEEVTYHYAALYNISREGLYVRTLVPLAQGEEVCLELRPPGQRRVHVRGTVAWARRVAQGAGIVPPGFGVQLSPEHCPPRDLEAYQRGYDVLAQDHNRSEQSPTSPAQRSRPEDHDSGLIPLS